jgi:hypothetical protein
MEVVRRALPACAVIAAFLPPCLAAQERPPADDRAVIAATLDGSLGAGYREKSVEKFLAAYAPGARIVNYIWGEIDRDTLGKKTLEDFAQLSGEDARVDVLEVRIEGGEAFVTINLGVTGVFRGEQRVSRQDRYYLRMRKDAAAWVIVEQSYRPDFQNSLAPHGGSR